MKKFIQKGIRHIFCKAIYGYKVNSGTLIKHLRKKGVQIGEGTVFFNPMTVTVDETDPYMLSIGKNCQITGGVTILTHDYGWAVTKAVYGDILGSIRPVEIGDNVYIGMNVIILAGAKIGNNVVIGANSVVVGNIPDNCVAVGNPCKYKYSLDEYHEKRKRAQLDEAVNIIRRYYKRHGKIPPEEVLREYFWLFRNNKDNLPLVFQLQNDLMHGSEDLTWNNFLNHESVFECYQDLVSYVLEKRKHGQNERQIER